MAHRADRRVHMPSYVSVLLRPGVGIQFNTFPDRAIVLPLPPKVQAEAITHVFLRARMPLTVGQIERELELCGVLAEFSREMLWELLAAGVLIDAPRSNDKHSRHNKHSKHGKSNGTNTDGINPAKPPVQILRSGVISAAISAALARASVEHEVMTYDLSFSCERPARELTDLAAQRGVLLTGGQVFLPTDAQATLVNLGVIHLPTGVVDGEIVVGPLIVPGQTACAFCIDQQLRQGDAGWHSIRDQVAGKIPTVSSADAYTSAVLLAHIVSKTLLPWLEKLESHDRLDSTTLVDIPDGLSHQTRIMLHTLDSHTQTFERLPRCPICRNV